MAELKLIAKQWNNLFQLKSFNDTKKSHTKIKIFKNSSFDSSINCVQSLNTNLSDLLLRTLPLSNQKPVSEWDLGNGAKQPGINRNTKKVQIKGASLTKNDRGYPKFSAILRAIRSIRLNRDEWKLIRYINLMEKKTRSNPLFGNHLEAFATRPRSCEEQIVPKIGSCVRYPNPFESNRVGSFLNSYFNNKSKKSHTRVATKRKLKNLNLFKIKKLTSLLTTRSCEGPLGSLRRSEASASKLLTFTNEHQMVGVMRNLLFKNKIFSYNNIISKNILLRNMKYNFLKSTLSSILKKKIRRISEILEDKPIKNYVLYSYLKNCIFTPSHLNGVASAIRRSKLSLNKYKGRKFGSRSAINYNKIIGYNFNSNFYQAFPNCYASLGNAVLNSKFTKAKQGVPSNLSSSLKIEKGMVQRLDGVSKQVSLGPKERPKAGRVANARSCDPNLKNSRSVCPEPSFKENRYIKDTYKLLFYLFKSMYCLISKPVLKYTNDKITIQLFYYLNIPKKKVFRLFSISYINSIKKKWLALSKNINKRARSSIHNTENTKIYIRWKLRKAISRLKKKIFSSSDGVVNNLLLKLRKFNLSKVYQNKFKLICAILSNKFNKPVELQLIRLHHPYHDSNILVNLLSLNIKNKRKKARVAIQKIFNKKPVKILNDSGSQEVGGGTGKLNPAFLSGLNIKIGGRLMGEPIIPRITTKAFGKGASATGKVNYLDVAKITKKNRKGAYTIKITSGQNFF